MKSTIITGANTRLGGLATSFGNIMDESQTNYLESSFITQTTKAKQQVNEVQGLKPVWMDSSKSNNRLS